MESAWRMDEIFCMKSVLRLDQQREYHRKMILDEQERNLLDYERPLKRIPVTRCSFGLRVKTLLKHLTP